MEEESESLMIVKTRASMAQELTAFVQKNHSYDVPEVIFTDITQGSQPVRACVWRARVCVNVGCWCLLTVAFTWLVNCTTQYLDWLHTNTLPGGAATSSSTATTADSKTTAT